MNAARRDAGGWHGGARRVESPNFERAPAGTAVDAGRRSTRSACRPGEYGGDAIERLFTNRSTGTPIRTSSSIRGMQVSAHFVIRRDGELLQFVSCDERAWHAGASQWRGATTATTTRSASSSKASKASASKPRSTALAARLLRDVARSAIRSSRGRTRARRAGAQARPGRGLRLARPAGCDCDRPCAPARLATSVPRDI